MPTTKRPASPAPEPAPAPAPPTDDGRASFDIVAPRLAALHPRELLAPTVDIGRVVTAAIGVALQVKEERLRARLLLLAKELFDHSQLELLEHAAWALWFVSEQSQKKRVLTSDAMVPLELAKQAAELESRMQEVCEHIFKKNPKVSPELDRLRPGTGYEDIAKDLQGYAAIYREYPSLVSRDPVYYQEGDDKLALELAARILQALGADVADAAAGGRNDLLARAWTFLEKIYTDVVDAIAFVERHQSPPPRYASLFAIGRPGSGGSKPRNVDDRTPADAASGEGKKPVP
jgi:hypothetical protein